MMQPGKRPHILDSTDSSPFASASPVHPGKQSLVEKFREGLRSALGEPTYELIAAAGLNITLSEAEYTIHVGNLFLVTWIRQSFLIPLGELGRSLIGPAASVRIEPYTAKGPCTTKEHGSSRNSSAATSDDTLNSGSVRGERKPSARGFDTDKSSPKSLASTPTEQPLGYSSFNRAATPVKTRRYLSLDDFVAGQGTEIAKSTAERVAARTISTGIILFYGGVGTGKTHLLEGVYGRLLKDSRLTTTLITAEAFGNMFSAALGNRGLPAFRAKFRNCDLLLVDDIDFLEAKRGFSQEFLHTIDEVLRSGGQVIATANRHPKLLTGLGDELSTRLAGGRTCRLEAPDESTRRQIALSKCQQLKVEIAPEALDYVAKRFTNNVRELEGAIHGLSALAEASGQPVTWKTAKQSLDGLARDSLRIIRLADVERVICEAFRVAPKDLRSERKSRSLAQPRMLAMFLSRKLTNSALVEIGEFYGGRNHSTVISAVRQVGHWIDENRELSISSNSLSVRELVMSLEQKLVAG